MNDVDVDEVEMFPAAVREWQTVAAIRRERDPFAIGRPRGTEVAAGAGRERLCAARLHVEDPEIGGAGSPRRYEHDLPAIRRERSLIVERRAVGQALEIGAVRTDAIEIRGTVTLGRERQPCAVG